MDRIPNEIWLQIFKYLGTYDLINFFTTFPQFSYFLRDKDVVKTFDLGGKFELCNLNLYTYISENVGCESIKTLNINKLYWIPVDTLRKIVKLLPNLEELLALDTKLGVRMKDLKVYSKLKKLSLSVETQQFTAAFEQYGNSFFFLRKLCLKIILRKDDSPEMYNFFNHVLALEELWIYDADESSRQPMKFDYIVNSLKFLKTLVIKSRMTTPFLEYKVLGLAKVFETRRFRTITMRFVKCPLSDIIPRELSIFEPYESPLEQAWDVLQKLHCEMPTGPINAQQIYFRKSLKDIQFDELNFYHDKCFCMQKFIDACTEILLSKNAAKLKKICINSCLLQIKRNTKWARVHELSNRDHPFKNVVKNCKELEELEIMHCTNCNVTTLEAYPLIKGFKCLKSLTVEVPVHLDGKFLKDVFIGCEHLETLILNSAESNERLNANLYLSLPYAFNLKHFRLQNVHINLDKLFLSLNQMGNCKLQRMFLKCNYIDTYNSKHFEEFLTKNPQLLFLFFAVANNVSRHNKILELMDIHKKDCRWKIYFTKKDEGYFNGNFPIPQAHHDILYNDTNVSVLDFTSF